MRLPFGNRCREVKRALAAPGGPGPALDADAVAEHLAACPACAAWAERDAALTRLWDATRPVEPSAAAWEAVRARLFEAPVAVPEVAAEPVVLPFVATRRVRLFVAAQAAAVVAALGLGIATARRPAPGDAPGPDAGRLAGAAVRPVTLEIDAGAVVLIRDDGRGVRPVEVAVDDRPNALDGNYAMLNVFESMDAE